MNIAPEWCPWSYDPRFIKITTVPVKDVEGLTEKERIGRKNAEAYSRVVDGIQIIDGSEKWIPPQPFKEPK